MNIKSLTQYPGNIPTHVGQRFHLSWFILNEIFIMIGAVGTNTPAIMATQPYILICYKTRKTNKYYFSISCMHLLLVDFVSA